MLEKYKNEKFDIILQGGQSNALGCGSGPAPFDYQEDEDILYLTPDMEISRATEQSVKFKSSGDFSLRFATLYKEVGLLEKGRKILIIRSAAGGTGFDDNRWRITNDLYLRMLNMTNFALDQNPGNRLVAFLWHQGENDLEHDATFYHHHLTSVVNGVRSTFHSPRLPFICGDFCHDWLRGSKLEHGWSEIMTGMISACIDIGHARCIMTYDLLSNHQKAEANEDQVHFCKESLQIIGERYFKAYLQLLER